MSSTETGFSWPIRVTVSGEEVAQFQAEVDEHSCEHFQRIAEPFNEGLRAIRLEELDLGLNLTAALSFAAESLAKFGHSCEAKHDGCAEDCPLAGLTSAQIMHEGVPASALERVQ